LSQLLSQQTHTSSQCSPWLRKHTQVLCTQRDLRKAPVSLAFKEGGSRNPSNKVQFWLSARKREGYIYFA